MAVPSDKEPMALPPDWLHQTDSYVRMTVQQEKWMELTLLD